VFKIRLEAMAAVVGAAALIACNPQRQQDCDKFVAVMKQLDEGTPTAATVDRVSKEVEALNLQDQPLQIYAANYRNTLTVLSSTLLLNESPTPPDGTDDVIKTHLKEARADSRDVQRYCAQ
jgi:hypothetical protein